MASKCIHVWPEGRVWHKTNHLNLCANAEVQMEIKTRDVEKKTTSTQQAPCDFWNGGSRSKWIIRAQDSKAAERTVPFTAPFSFHNYNTEL